MDNPNKRQLKNFWEKPEGTTGMIFLAAMIIGGGFLLSAALPFIISLLQSTLTAVILFLVLAAILYVAMDKRFRTLIGYMYKSLMRFITGIFIQIDPIGIIESYIEDLKENLRDMVSQLEKLRGHITKLKREISTNESEIERLNILARKAKDMGKQPTFVVNTRQAGRLVNLNQKLTKIHTKTEMLYRVLNKMYENSKILVADTENQVDMMKREHEITVSSYNVMQGAKRIINGDPDQKAIFDQTMEYLAEDMAMKLGEIDTFLEMSDDFINNIDLQNEVDLEMGLKQLEEWEEKNNIMSILDGDVTPATTAHNAYVNNEVPAQDPPKTVGSNRYRSMI